MTVKIKKGFLFSNGVQVAGISTTINNSNALNVFVNLYRDEIIEYGESRSKDTILTYLIRKGQIAGEQKAVKDFIKEWKKEGVVIQS